MRLANASGTSKISGDASTGMLICVSLTQTSDSNLKKDVEAIDIANASKFIYKLNPVKFRFIDTDEKLHHGFLAQQVEGIADYDLVGDTESGKTLNYIELIADIVATLQSQDERLRRLEGA